MANNVCKERKEGKKLYISDWNKEQKKTTILNRIVCPALEQMVVINLVTHKNGAYKENIVSMN